MNYTDLKIYYRKIFRKKKYVKKQNGFVGSF